jgi:hypothetical protein
MNRSYGFLLLASMASCLEFLGPGSWGSAQDAGEVVELGKLKSRVPADWVKERPDHPSIYKQYRLEPAGDDKEDARLTIRFLRNGNGHSAEKQVQRWKAMFLPPERVKMDHVVKVHQWKVGAAAVTYLDVRGDYKGIPGNPATPRENFRLLGLYFDTPEGSYLIRVLGPADTVEYYREEFEDWVKAFK